MHARIRKSALTLAVALVVPTLAASPARADGAVRLRPYSDVQIILDDPDPVGPLTVKDRKNDNPRDGQQATPHGATLPESPAPLPPILRWARRALCVRPGAPVAVCIVEWTVETTHGGR